MYTAVGAPLSGQPAPRPGPDKPGPASCGRHEKLLPTRVLSPQPAASSKQVSGHPLLFHQIAPSVPEPRVEQPAKGRAGERRGCKRSRQGNRESWSVPSVPALTPRPSLYICNLSWAPTKALCICGGSDVYTICYTCPPDVDPSTDK